MSSSYFHKSQYIFIDSIDDIDPRRISIRDLNKKYMDREGNRYALRFDLNSRKINIVRLAGSKDEALRIRAEILKKRKAEKGMHSESEDFFQIEDSSSLPEFRSTPSNRPAGPDRSEPLRPASGKESHAETLPHPSEIFSDAESGFIDDFLEPGTRIINEIDLFPELEREISRILDSQKAIVKVMGRVRALEESGKSEEFFAAEKKIDEWCIQKAADAARLYQELSGFPRSPSHYLGSFPINEKKRIEAMADERQQIEEIKRFELHRTYSELLNNIQDLTIKLRLILDSLPESEHRKKYFTDLIPSFSEITGKIASLQHKLHQWFKQTS